MTRFAEKILQILPNRQQSPETRYKKMFYLWTALILLIVLIAAYVAFFIEIRAVEKVVVPQLEGLEIIDALVRVSERGLYPRIIERISPDQPRGLVVGQEPRASGLVKMGSIVLIRVSKGLIYKRLDDFRGLMLKEVEEIVYKMRESLGRDHVTLKKPIIKIENSAAAETVINQKPEPGALLTDKVEIELIVSAGSGNQTIKAPDFVGLDCWSALRYALDNDLIFTFKLNESDQQKNPGKIVDQSPAPGREIGQKDLITLTVDPPEKIPEGWKFGVYAYQYPVSSVTIPLKVEAVSVGGQENTLLEYRFAGGNFAFPYLQPENDLLKIIFGDDLEFSTSVGGRDQENS